MVVEIITPEQKLYSGEVKLLHLPGSGGSFGMLNHHAPIISALDAGTVRVVEKDGKEHTFQIKGGILESSNNKAIVLAE